MSTTTEIAKAVDAFVADLLILIRAAALEHVRAALGALPTEATPQPPSSRAPARSKRAAP